MVRIGLTLYLVLSIAVGPSLCCCLPGDLLALCTSASSARHHCCGHPSCDRDHSSKKPSDVPGDPSPAPHRHCPCKEASPELLVFLAPEHSSGAEEGRFPDSSRSIEAGWFLLSVNPLSLPTQGQLPTQPITGSWHDPRDILRALHILRC
jgi:hypothetical protein